MSKFQVPTVGGIRKVIQQPSASVGTTIAELGQRTVTLAQLAQLIAAATPPVNTGGGNISTGAGPSISVGPGLSGGGPIVGNVPIRLTQPPALIAEDGVDGDPGLQGIQGPQGSQGIPGAYWFGEDGADGDPGVQGIQGAPGVPGLQGIPGGAWFSEDSYADEFLAPFPGTTGVHTVDNLLTVNQLGNNTNSERGLIIQSPSGAQASVAVCGNRAVPGTNDTFIFSDSANSGYLGANGNNTLHLQTNAVNRVDITGGGNVTVNGPSSGDLLTIIGNTVVAGNVAGASTSFAYTIGANPSATITSGGYIQLYGSTNASPTKVAMGANNTTYFTISSSGNALFAAPSSGNTLTAQALGGSYGASIQGSNNSNGPALLVNGNFTGGGTVDLVRIQDLNNTNGANIHLLGPGVTTPGKFIRAVNGNLEIVNDAYTATIFQLVDNGNLTLINVGSNPTLTLSNGSGITYAIGRDVATGFLKFTGNQASFSGFQFADATGVTATLRNGGGLQVPQSPLNSTLTQVVTGLANFKPTATISTGTALTADAALTVTCNETGWYDLDIFLSFYETSVGTGGIQFDVGGGTATLGAFRMGVTAFAGGASALQGGVTSSATATSFATITTSSTAQDWAHGKGTFNVTSPGTVAVRWAQASVLSTASTSLTTGSSIILTKIG